MTRVMSRGTSPGPVTRAVDEFIEEYARRPPVLDRALIVVDRALLARAVYMLSRCAAEPSVAQATRIAAVDIGMALVNADKLGAERMRQLCKATT